VIVTGGAGFIGSHLVERLAADGSDVLVIDDLSTGSEQNVDERASLERLDIANDGLEGVFAAWRPDVVFHLAAQSSVPRSQEEPLYDLRVNVEGTHRVVAATEAARADRLVFVSSGGAIYGECRTSATEERLPTPLSFYGVHKLAAEGHVALSGVPWVVIRPSNVYGRRQLGGTDGAVVAVFVDRALRDEALEIHGDGTQTRDLIHVDDVVTALVLLGDPTRPEGTFNVAFGRSVTVLKVASMVERAQGRHLDRIFRPRRAGDVTRSAMSATKLRRLGWRPSTSLRSGLARLFADRQPGADFG
jgi:UDP-glucose 4-epimerase